MLHPQPWYTLAPLTRELTSATIGVALALLVIIVTRVAVQHTAWARRLHRDLRPVALELSPTLIVVLAILSSSGEELLFRSFLTPWIGVVPQAVLFGLLHQVRGPSRWIWVTWATAAGVAFGAMYEVLGTLSGPILAHALINAVNLRYLRNHDPDSS